MSRWGWDTASTHQCYLFAVFLPPHSTSAQVSLKKCPPLPPCVREDIRHWRDQQTEEAKINRRNRFGSDRCNRLKPCSWYWLHRKGPIDLEKYKPDQGTIRKWTDPTIPTTPPEKVLDIFLLLLRSFFFFNFKASITPLIFSFITYYFAKKRHFLKAKFIYIYLL